ncbi:MAG: hypothetical protein EWM72_00626 [Nitrospira sp.]|nr:MAG: hypothetical protein EWM72_00626 [Nitrospira sp.]
MNQDNTKASGKTSERRAEYLKQFKDPRWQKMRLQVFNRDEFACQICFGTESTLHVHHRYYRLTKTCGSIP